MRVNMLLIPMLVIAGIHMDICVYIYMYLYVCTYLPQLQAGLGLLGRQCFDTLLLWPRSASLRGFKGFWRLGWLKSQDPDRGMPKEVAGWPWQSQREKAGEESGQKQRPWPCEHRLSCVRNLQRTVILCTAGLP